MKRKLRQAKWYLPEGSLFNKEYLRYYEEKILTPERTIREANFIEKVLDLKPGVEILDLACGAGRHAIELARRGYKVTGQDINYVFLKEAAKAANKAGVSIRLMNRDMRRIPFRNKFDVVLNLFTSFGFFEKEEDHQKVIDGVSKALKPGGLFLIDFHHRDHLISHYNSRDFIEFEGGAFFLLERNFDPFDGRNYERRILISETGQKKEVTLNIRFFTLTEMVLMCQKASLVYQKSYGDFRESPVDLNTKRCILIMKK